MKKLIWVLCLGIASQGVKAPFAFANGHETGNPGDLYASEFRDIAIRMARFLQSQPLAEVDPALLQRMIQETEVTSEAELTLNGQSVDAINLPALSPPKIILSRKSWDQVGDQLFQKMQLVLHEYLGVMRVDDQAFRVSGQLVNVDICLRTPSVRKQIETSLRQACYKIDPYELRFVTDAFNLHERSLRPADLRGLSKIQTLSISGLEHANEIPPGLFLDLHGLSILALYGNSITQLNEGDFNGANPWQLTLGNRIKVLRQGTFRRLSRLYKFHLEELMLEEIEEGAFDGLKSVEYFFWTPNLESLPRLHKDSFRGLEGLKHFVVMGRGLERLPANLMAQYIPQIELRDENLTDDEAGTFLRLSQVFEKEGYRCQNLSQDQNMHAVVCSR